MYQGRRDDDGGGDDGDGKGGVLGEQTGQHLARVMMRRSNLKMMKKSNLLLWAIAVIIVITWDFQLQLLPQLLNVMYETINKTI